MGHLAGIGTVADLAMWLGCNTDLELVGSTMRRAAAGHDSRQVEGFGIACSFLQYPSSGT